MELFKWIAVIIGIIMAAEVAKQYLKNKSDNGKHNKALEDKLERLNELEDRVKTLERIVTDPSSNLRREIDGLKD